MTAGFPRPLSPFERYMLVDDRPGYRMTFLVQIDFDAPFHKSAMDSAFTMALERHPMLRTTVENGRVWREPVPASQAHPLRWLAWADDTPVEAFAPMDISREAGMRFFVQAAPDRMRWTVQTHHAVADGASIARFCWEVGTAYAALRSAPGTEPMWEAMEQDAPGSEPATAPSGTVVPPLSEIAEFLMRRPVRVRTPHQPAAGPDLAPGEGPVPPVADYTFDAAAFGRMRRTARAHDASVNDVFLAALLQTVAEWNAPTAPFAGREWLRIMVPTDLRTRDHAGLGAMNVLGYAFLDRRACDCADASALLRSVAGETRDIRSFRIGSRILGSMSLVDRVPGLLRLILKPRVTLASAVFSNVGRVGTRIPGASGRSADHFGDVIPSLTRTRGMVPLRPGTRVGFVLARLRNTLTLTLRADPHSFDRAAADAFLAAYVARVHAMVNSSATA